MENYIIYPKQLRRQTIPVEKNRCFFLMPFSHDFDVIYGTVKKNLNDLGLICNRADEICGSTPILTKILTEIMKSQYIIVDLTDSNPNVFYELGIAHTLKEARNVLLIKQKNYKVPFDITHLTYIEYEPTNLLLLVSMINSFIHSSKSTNTLYEALNLHNIIGYIDENNNDFIDMLQSSSSDVIPILSKALLGEGSELTETQIQLLVSSFKSTIGNIQLNSNVKTRSIIFDIYFETFASIPENSIIQELIGDILGELLPFYNFSELNSREYKTRLSLILAQNEMYMDFALTWIINYFSRSKTANIDLNRYSIEHFLMTTTSKQVNAAIINSLCNTDCYIREHMSDIIGEKNLKSAINLLLVQLSSETNYFTAQSMIEAIGKLNCGGINVIEKWIEDNKNNIIKTNQLFVLKHAYIAISKLDNTCDQCHIQNFNKQFGQIIKDYYII